jgi:putative ABC transport system permease protein
VQAVRAIESEVRGEPAVLLAFDEASDAFKLYEGKWRDVADRFWAGEGVLVSDNLARMRHLRTGDRIDLDAPSGSVQFKILGIFPDYTGGSQLGSLAISRSVYRRLWSDTLVTRIRIWLKPEADAPGVRREINRVFGPSRGLQALSLEDLRSEVVSLIGNAFRLMYALVAVAFTVSFVGVTSFFLTSLADRTQELLVQRACGVAAGEIARGIAIEGGLVGAVGSILGVVAGLAGAAIIIFHSVPIVTGWRFTFAFPLAPAVSIAVGTVALAAGAGWLPGLASRHWMSERQERAE